MEKQVVTLTDVNIQDVIAKFQRGFPPDTFVDCSIPNHIINILVFEEFFFRIESNLACTIVFNQVERNTLEITLIVAGGSKGILGWTWGAETSMLYEMKEFFDSYSSSY